MTSFDFSTDGTTDAVKDLSSARVYYTGSINGFLTTNPFGQPVIKPNGNFTITGDQALSSGVNYFWLAYELTVDATEGNYVDATCDSFTINNTIIPAITSPDSNRHIEVVYCDAGATNLAPEHINHVIIGSIDQLSDKGANGYEDYSSLLPEVKIGEPFDIIVYNSDPHNTNALLIWIDYNRDGDFEDDGELVYDSGPAFFLQYNVHVTPPIDVHIGLTRMRIRLHDTFFGPNPSPCGLSNIGEVEDYGLIINDVMSSNEDIGNEKSFFVFPNPFVDKFFIRSNVVNAIPFYITDITGRDVYSGILEKETEVALKRCIPGMYIIRLGKERMEIV
ncbi:MAG TPA: GEVED domain-containing protein, partial [Saprospiraceae bacterium]|nr:GEVED domain-containing protein [Saprospiraceae bacterium]